MLVVSDGASVGLCNAGGLRRLKSKLRFDSLRYCRLYPAMSHEAEDSVNHTANKAESARENSSNLGCSVKLNGTPDDERRVTEFRTSRRRSLRYTRSERSTAGASIGLLCVGLFLDILGGAIHAVSLLYWGAGVSCVALVMLVAVAMGLMRLSKP